MRSDQRAAPQGDLGEADFDVAIIGAGFSGLAAGRALTRAGAESVVVLEARDRVGGRVYNQTVGGDFPVPAGAAWVGPGQDAVIDLAEELGVPLTPQFNTGDTFVVAGGEALRVPTTASPVTDQKFVETLNALAVTVPIDAPWTAPNAREWDAMTYADHLSTARLSDDDLAAVDMTTLLTFGAPPKEISFLHVLGYIHGAGGLERLESVEGGAQERRVVGGSQILAVKMAQELGDRVRLASGVNAVRDWDGLGPVEIETATGVIRARRVIMALSPSQASAIDFTPALPDAKAAMIAAWPTAGSGVKVHVSYDKPFWRERGLSGNVYNFDSDLFAWAADASPTDGSIGVLTTLGLAGESLSPEERQAQTLQTLAGCFGPDAMEPTGYVEFDWSQETHTAGCVSPLGTGFLTRHGAAIRAATGVLTWAGTETATEWMGYMDGAVRAGERAASESLAALEAAKEGLTR